jgi:hypothetical protein
MPFGLEIKDFIVFAGGAFVALVVAYIFYKKGLQRKQLSYSVRIRSLVYRSPSYPVGLKDGLKISFDGKDVHRLTRVTLYVWNSGNQPIIQADLNTKIPLVFETPEKGFDVLQTSITDQTRAANNARVEDRRMVFDYLNPRDGFVVDIFGDENDENARLTKGDIGIKGDIVGITREPQESDYEFSASRAPGYVFLAVGAFLAIAVISNFVDLNLFGLKIPPRAEYILSTVAAIIMGLMATLFLFGGCILIFAQERLPTKLLGSDAVGYWRRLLRTASPAGAE